MNGIDPRLKKILRKFMEEVPHLALESGKKHARVRNTVSNDWIPVGGSTGDRRAIKSFECDLRRLSANGEGLIHAKTRRPRERP